MYAVVVGGGRIGRTIARWLLMAEHEVAVVDRSPAVCSVVEDELGSVSVLGDATEAGVSVSVNARIVSHPCGAVSPVKSSYSGV